MRLSPTILLAASMTLLAPASAWAGNSYSDSARAGSTGIGSLRVFTGRYVESPTRQTNGSTTIAGRQGWGVAFVPKGNFGSVQPKGLMRTQFWFESKSAKGRTSEVSGRQNVVGAKVRTPWGGTDSAGTWARGVVTQFRGRVTNTWKVGNPRTKDYNDGTIKTVKGRPHSAETTSLKIHPSGASEHKTTRTSASGVTTTQTRTGTPDGQMTKLTTLGVAKGRE